jgi:hypothetical protein
MSEDYCIYKLLTKNYLIPLTIIVGYIGYNFYQTNRNESNSGDSSIDDEPPKKYICGALGEVSNNDEELKLIISEYLDKQHDYTGDFEIIKAQRQVVAGIKYIVEIKKADDETNTKLSFIHRAWKEDKFEDLQNTSTL